MKKESDDSSIKGSAEIIAVDPDRPGESVSRAGRIIREGGLVAYPTESFYGLAADITNPRAIERIFLAKKREKGRPILIIIPSVEVLGDFVTRIPGAARMLMERFWPGGLTLVFEAGSRILPVLTAGTGKIGIRLSSHPVATSLAQASGVPVTGTSANLSNQPPADTADEVYRQIGGAIDLILDGGGSGGKTGSTVLDVTETPPVILREGMVGREEITMVLDKGMSL